MLRGAFLQVPRVVASASEVNAWYECDLIGMTVADETGHELGVSTRFGICRPIRSLWSSRAAAKC